MAITGGLCRNVLKGRFPFGWRFPRWISGVLSILLPVLTLFLTQTCLFKNMGCPRGQPQEYKNLLGKLHHLQETTNLTRSPGQVVQFKKYFGCTRNHINLPSATGMGNLKVAYSLAPFNQQGSTSFFMSRAFSASSSTPFGLFTAPRETSHGGG